MDCPTITPISIILGGLVFLGILSFVGMIYALWPDNKEKHPK